MNDKPTLRLFAGDPQLLIDLPSLALDDRAGEAGLNFAFTYLSVPLSCHCAGDGKKATLSVSAVIGPVPYTAESIPARNALLAIIGAANDNLGEVFSVVDGKIVLKRDFVFFTQVNIANLVAALVGAVAPLRPYIETFARYIVLPAEGKGAGKVRPAWRRSPQP
ncbi:hypothetical protein FACS1894205_4050 [Alphaproteobacteria bacterium]|nr:hypothetical protein FACS1894205_4050 [Alphaproteobacteria bacterium]